MARASTYNVGDTMIFNRPCKRLRVEKGDERTVTGIDWRWGTVHLADAKGNATPWRPGSLAAAKGGVEVYRGEAMELRRGDWVRFTRNEPASGLTNGETATVESVERGGVVFRLDDGKIARLGTGDAQLRYIDRAFAATVHAFQGRTRDRILAAMPAENPNLVNRRAFYVAISRARDAAMLVTDDAHRLADRLERATGERLTALDATAKEAAWETVFGRDSAHDRAGDHVTRAPDAMDRGDEVTRDGQRQHERERDSCRGPGRQTRREREREHRPGRESGRDRDGKAAARSTERARSGQDSVGKGHELDGGGGRQGGVPRDAANNNVAEPKQKTPDLDLGL